jgi:hypothetical protein
MEFPTSNQSPYFFINFFFYFKKERKKTEARNNTEMVIKVLQGNFSHSRNLCNANLCAKNFEVTDRIVRKKREEGSVGMWVTICCNVQDTFISLDTLKKLRA